MANHFKLTVYDAKQQKRFSNVIAFVGEDASGSFGILANHARFMTILVFGLARFRVLKQPWQYLAVPGAVLYFNNDELSISTRHFLIDENFERISSSLEQQLMCEEENLRTMKESLHHMEESMLKRLWKIKNKPLP